MNRRILLLAVAAGCAIGFVRGLQASEPAEDAQRSSRLPPVIAVIGSGETLLGLAGSTDITMSSPIGGLVDSLYV